MRGDCASGAETRCYRVQRKDRNRPLPLAEAFALTKGSGARLLINGQSQRAAVQMPAASLMDDEGPPNAELSDLRDCMPVIPNQQDWPMWLGEAEGDYPTPVATCSRRVAASVAGRSACWLAAE
jgi:hypothetical protein